MQLARISSFSFRFAISRLPVASFNSGASEGGSFTPEHHKRLGVLIKQKKFDRVRSYFESLKAHGNIPTMTTHYIIADGYAKSGDDNAIFEYLNTLKSESLYVDARVYNPIIAGLATNGKLSEAEALIEEMRRENIGENGGTYSAILKGYVEERLMDKARNTFELMKQKNISPNQLTQSQMIRGYARVGDIKEARAVLKAYLDEGGVPLPLAYASLISAYFRSEAHSDKDAENILTEMSQAGITPDFRVFNALVGGFAEAGNIEKAKDVITQAGQIANTTTYDVLISTLSRAGKFEDALSTIQQMKDNNIERRRTTYGGIFHSLVQSNPEEALRVLNLAQEDGVVPSNFMFDTLAQKLEETGKSDLAAQVRETAEEHRQQYSVQRNAGRPREFKPRRGQQNEEERDY